MLSVPMTLLSLSGAGGKWHHSLSALLIAVSQGKTTPGMEKSVNTGLCRVNDRHLPTQQPAFSPSGVSHGQSIVCLSTVFCSHSSKTRVVAPQTISLCRVFVHCVYPTCCRVCEIPRQDQNTSHLHLDPSLTLCMLGTECLSMPSNTLCLLQFHSSASSKLSPLPKTHVQFPHL